MSEKKDKFEKAKEDIAKAFKEHPNANIVEMDFDISDDLTEYLQTLEDEGHGS